MAAVAALKPDFAGALTARFRHPSAHDLQSAHEHHRETARGGHVDREGLPASSGRRPADRGARGRRNHLGRRWPGIPRRRRRGDRRQRRTRAAVDRGCDGAPGARVHVRSRDDLHERTAGAVRPRRGPASAGRRPGDLPGQRRLGGDRELPEAGSGLSPGPPRAGPDCRDRAPRQLPRQLHGGAGSVGPRAAAPALRAVARTLRATSAPRIRTGRERPPPMPWATRTRWSRSSNGPSPKRARGE